MDASVQIEMTSCIMKQSTNGNAFVLVALMMDMAIVNVRAINTGPTGERFIIYES